MTDTENEFKTVIGQDMPSSRRELEEDMLEKLFRLEKNVRVLTLQGIESHLNMSRRDMNYYLKQMKKHGYVEINAQDGIVEITELGKVTGMECQYRHDTFTQFLQYVGVRKEQAAEDACRIEHVASDETVRQICNFVNYGETYERVIRHTDLSFRYEPGRYQFLMGIYYLDRTCPRKIAREADYFSENISFCSQDSRSWFELEYLNPVKDCLWYMTSDKGWVKAVMEENKAVIPSEFFEYSIRQKNPVSEGSLLVAFAREGDRPREQDSRELDVHIW